MNINKSNASSYTKILLSSRSAEETRRKQSVASWENLTDSSDKAEVTVSPHIWEFCSPNTLTNAEPIFFDRARSDWFNGDIIKSVIVSTFDLKDGVAADISSLKLTCRKGDVFTINAGQIKITLG